MKEPKNNNSDDGVPYVDPNYKPSKKYSDARNEREKREILRKVNPPIGLMSKTKTLAYSTLSDKVYWVDGKGNKHDVTDNFINVMMLWLTQESGAYIEKDTRHIRTLSYDGVPHWELSLMKLKD